MESTVIAVYSMAVTGSNSTDSEDTPFQRSIGAELVDQLSLQDPHYSSQRLLLHVPPSSFSTSFHKSLTPNPPKEGLGDSP